MPISPILHASEHSRRPPRPPHSLPYYWLAGTWQDEDGHQALHRVVVDLQEVDHDEQMDELAFALM